MGGRLREDPGRLQQESFAQGLALRVDHDLCDLVADFRAVESFLRSDECFAEQILSNTCEKRLPTLLLFGDREFRDINLRLRPHAFDVLIDADEEDRSVAFFDFEVRERRLRLRREVAKA